MDIEPGDLVVEMGSDHSVCPHAERHRHGLDGFSDEADTTGTRYVVRSVTPTKGLPGCFMLGLSGLDGEWCFGTFRKLRPDELPRRMKRVNQLEKV